jgi:hypothetical protein
MHRGQYRATRFLPEAPMYSPNTKLEGGKDPLQGGFPVTHNQPSGFKLPSIWTQKAVRRSDPGRERLEAGAWSGPVAMSKSRYVLSEPAQRLCTAPVVNIQCPHAPTCLLHCLPSDTKTDATALGASPGPFERLATQAPDDVRNELHGNMSAYLPIEYVTTLVGKFTSSVAKEDVLSKVAEFQTKTGITGASTKVPFRFGSFKNQETQQFNLLLRTLIQYERAGNLLVIGNGGAGVAGFFMYLANDPRLVDVTIIWRELLHT